MSEDSRDLQKLATTVHQEITSSRRYLRQNASDNDADRPIKYWLGDMDDFIEHEEHKSGVVSYDVADTIGWIMPDLMRLFFAGNRVVDFLPSHPEDEEYTEQASDYINHVFLNENRGYFVFWDAAHDGLLNRNGVIKVYWHGEPEYRIRDLTGLDQETFQQLVLRDDVEVLEHSTETQVMEAPEEAGTLEVPVHAVKVQQMLRKGRIIVKSLPTEEYFIDTEATDIHDARFHSHRYHSTRSDLIKDGYSREQIEALPVSVSLEFDEERLAREEEHDAILLNPRGDKAMEMVEVHECYIQYDMNDDGIAEWLQVIMAGGVTQSNILHWEEWGDPIPFVDLCPERVPHRFEGRSIYDSTHDIQEVKTVLLRNTMDSLYDALSPERVVVEDQIIDPDALLNPRYGEAHRVKSDVNAIKDLPKPFIGQHSFSMLEYWDNTNSRRTGVSQHSQAMDPERLQNQSATAVNLSQSMAHSKVELIGRNYKEGGMKDLFKKMLQLAVNHQDVPVTVRLRNKWVQVDPSQWSADMDAVVNTGLGTGNRDRDLMFLFRILEIQKEIMANLGPDNPVVRPSQMHNTLEKIVHGSGMPSADMFFSEVEDEVMAQWWQQRQKEMADQATQMDGQAKAFVEVEGMKVQQRNLEAQLKAATEQFKAQQDLKLEELRMSKDALQIGAKANHDAEQQAREHARQVESQAFEGRMRTIEARVKILIEALRLQQHGISPDESAIHQQLNDVVGVMSKSVEEFSKGSTAPRDVETDEEGNVLRVSTEQPSTPVPDPSDPVATDKPSTRVEDAVANLALMVGDLQQAMLAPKKVIHDPETGRISGWKPDL